MSNRNDAPGTPTRPPHPAPLEETPRGIRSSSLNGLKPNTSAKKETHDAVDALVDDEMNGTVFELQDGDGDLVDRLIPDVKLPFRNTLEALQSVCREAKLYSSKRKEWQNWPSDGLTGSDNERAEFIMKLVKTARAHVPNHLRYTIPRRYWSAKYSDTPISDKDCDRKPDGVLLDNSVKNATWANVLGIFEHKSGNDEKNAIEEVISSARMIFAAQDRRFVLGVTIVNKGISLHILNRSGMIYSHRVSIHEQPLVFVKIVVGLAFLDRESLGFDPTIFPDPTDRTAMRIRVDDISYRIVSILSPRQRCIQSRGTVCFEVVDADNQLYVVKDVWVDESRKYKEHQILEELRETEHVIRLHKYWVVDVGDGLHTTKTLLDEFCSDFETVDDVAAREHRRYVLEPACEPIHFFKSKLELANGFVNWIEALQKCYENHDVLHRDISANNLMFKRGTEAVRNGILIDFDFAIRGTEHREIAKAERSGTVPFIALDILNTWKQDGKRNDPIAHSPKHDLESLLYVFCYLCTVLAGPRRTDKVKKKNYPTIRPGSSIYDFETTRLARWFYRGKKDMESLADSKGIDLGRPKTFEDNVVSKFHSYFEDMKECAHELRDLLDPDIKRGTSNLRDRYRQLGKGDQFFEELGPTHESFLEVFRNLRTELELKHGEAPPVPDPGADPLDDTLVGLPQMSNTKLEDLFNRTWASDIPPGPSASSSSLQPSISSARSSASNVTTRSSKRASETDANDSRSRPKRERKK